MENKCLICDKPLEIWDNTDSSNIQYRCADGHPPREGREDGGRCDGSGWTMLTQSGQWPPEREMCLGCDNCRKPEAAKQAVNSAPSNVNDVRCKSCDGPATYDPKRYPGGFFCENAGCPAYQGIPARKEMPERFKGSCQFPSSHSAADWAICRLPEHGVPAHGAAKGEAQCETCKQYPLYRVDSGKVRIVSCHLCPTSPSEVGGEDETAKRIVEQYERRVAQKGHLSLPWLRTLIAEELALTRSRSEKVGEARAWGRAVAAIAEKKRTDRRELITHTGKVEMVEVYPSQNDAGWMLARRELIQAAKDDGHQVG